MRRARPAAIPAGRGHPADLRQQGAVTILTLGLLLATFALAALLVEVGSALIAHRELLDAADAAARAGATALDLEVYRASGGQTAQLAPRLAEQTARGHLRRTHHTGPATVTATTTSITVALSRAHPPLIFGFVAPVRLTATATAQPQTGISTQGQGARP